ncbi:MAG: hydrogenase formation protein HypD [Acidobacteria bacterium]|jgi:hydrogenase expression/formation protein HypD|nr:hydrogenase formation protein HypD [Acidobacteriota bacterium]
MRHVDEYRDPTSVQAVARLIQETARRRWTLMEVCGGQTHSILKFGLDELLPSTVNLVHGPGCPVCVTPLALIDRAVAIASRPDVSFCSFGDMLRVPGSETDLLKVKASGGDVRIVYSPLDALRLAREHPEKKVVFFAVGFETTAPANAMAVSRAAAEGVSNFSVLVAHVLVPPALEALLGSGDVAIQGLLAPGHVCTVTGYRDYEPLSARYRVPIVVTGFEPLDLLKGVLAAVAQLERGEHRVENQYPRAVVRDGNPQAVRMIEDVFVVSDRSWRGVGEIPRSGYALAPKYGRFDAEKIFDVGGLQASEPEECRSGLVLQGRLRPTECPEFGTRCTPEHPLGATMVSSEGACAAYFHYGRARLEAAERPELSRAHTTSVTGH